MLELAGQLAAEHGLTLDVNDRALYGEAFALFSPDRAHRYLLGRRWVPELGKTAVFLMLNPSTADAFKLDPTLRRCKDFAQRWGCGGMAIVNLYAYRATKPKVMLAAPDPVGPANDTVIAAVSAHLGERGVFVAGWGNHGAAGGRGAAMSSLLFHIARDTYCLAMNSSGHPQHPLYVPAVAELRPLPTIAPPGLARRILASGRH